MNVVTVNYRNTISKNTCYLTGAKLNSLGIIYEINNLVLTVGSRDLALKLIVDDNLKSDAIIFSNDIKNTVEIPEDTTVQIMKTGENHIEIGPLIGVFISIKKVNNLMNGQKDSIFEQFTDACKYMNGICAFFSIDDIDWGSNLTHALIWEKNRWVKCILPLPRVIYDRSQGGRKYAYELRRKLKNGYHIINAIPKLGKWETILALKKNKKLADLIPETIKYHSYLDIINALKRFPSVYLKPDRLQKGKGIFKISKGPDDLYTIESRTPQENIILHWNNLERINELIKDYIVKGNGYIIQNEIKKASYRGLPFDFRLLYQKNWQAKWLPSGIAVRMGAPGSIITSPRSGGKVEKFSTVLKEVFNQDITTKNGLYENVINIGKEVVNEIEKQFGDCVELGLDMTIDVNGKVWIIEVNAKPLKVSLAWLNDKKLISLCYKRPLEYAVYLTGFVPLNTEIEQICF